jgi:hypothetical protein
VQTLYNTFLYCNEIDIGVKDEGEE